MLNRVRALFQQSAKLESSATILRKNGRRGTKATTTTTVTTTPTNNAGNTNNNSNNSSNNNNNNNSNKWGQYLRTAFFIGIVGYTFGKNALDTNNPNSPINKFLYPNKQGKYALKVERLDDKLSNYKTSWIKAKDGIPSAMASAMRHLNMKRIGLQVDELPLSDQQIRDILAAGQSYQKAILKLQEDIDKTSKEYMELALLETSQQIQQRSKAPPKKEETTAAAAAEKEASSNTTTAAPPTPPSEEDKAKKVQEVKQALAGDNVVVLSDNANKIRDTLLTLLNNKLTLELGFMANVELILTKEQKTRLAYEKDPSISTRIRNKVLQIDHTKYEFLLEKLAKISLLPSYEKSKVFVLQFNGDTQANQVQFLREEITAILNIANPARGDQVILQLNSPGGTVTGYGLAAAQLLRLKEHGLRLTISVDEVAASGGYLMASVGDEIVSSPFAIFGSIGVIATIPNFAERLQREGVSVEDVTAGKYKRTMTPYKKPTEEDRQKMKNDVEEILKYFKQFVKTNRPNLTVDMVATGETWLASEAVKKGLVDKIATTDDLLLQFREKGFEVYSVAIRPIIRPWGVDEDGTTMSFSSIFKSIFYSMFSSFFKDMIQENSFSGLPVVLENHNLYQMNEKSLGLSSESIHHRILAIDPKDHPRL